MSQKNKNFLTTSDINRAYSPELLKKNRSWKLNPRNLLLSKIKNIRVISRKFVKTILHNKKNTLQNNFDHNEIMNFDDRSKFFQDNGYAYLTNVINNDLHNNLVNNFPPLYEFEPPEYLPRFYETWNVMKIDGLEERLKYYPSMNVLCIYLMSEEFYNSIYKFINDKIKRITTSIVINRSYSGSILLPHIDKESSDDAVNLIYFIYSNGTSIQAGGTSFFKNNTYNQPFFIPDSLINTAVIYRLKEKIFHGFPKIQAGFYRYAITQTLRKA